MSYSQAIREYLIESGILDSDRILADTESLLEQGIIDSIVILDLTDFISRRFQFRVKEADLVPDNFDSIAAISAFIQRNASN